MNQQDLFIEMQYLRRFLAKLLPELPPQAEDWRPRENMRSVWEVEALNAKLVATTPEGLLAIFDEGLAEVERYCSTMPPEEFEEKIASSFHGFGMPIKAWLLESVTHTHHHRAMLHTYVGRPVDQSYTYC
jgi:hypothetical protein